MARVKDRVYIDLVTGSPLGDLPSVMGAIRGEYGDLIQVRIFPVQVLDGGKMDEDEAYRTLRTGDVVLYDIRGNGRAYRLIKRLYDTSSANMCSIYGGSPDILSLTRLGSFSMRELSAKSGGQAQVDYTKIKQMGRMADKLGEILPPEAAHDARNWVSAVQYWSNPHEKNLKNLILLMAKEYGLKKTSLPGNVRIMVEPPIEKPDYGICHPQLDAMYENLDEYLDAYGYDPLKPTVGILYYGNVHNDVSLVGVRALAGYLEPAVNVLPVFTGGVQNIVPMKKYFTSPKAPVDAIISIIWFRLNGGPMGGDQSTTAGLLTLIDAPVFTPITMYSADIKEWEESPSGSDGVAVLATVTFPEIDGSIEPIPVFGLEPIPGYGEVRTARAIGDRVRRVAGRVLNRISLKYKPNKEKKLAFVIYDYPPGESNIGNAAYLDTFKSLESILKKLAEEGYSVPGQMNVKDAILSLGAVNSPEFIPNSKDLVRVSKEKYVSWYGRLPDALRARIEEDWGAAPGNIMVDKDDIVLPIICAGNALICIQPSRGVHEDRSKAYHDKALTPHHQYVAFYHYLSNEFKADAIVHVGTHGTIEFLPGKEVGLSSNCYPDVLMGDMPHFYFYHVTNPSEAVIAKRRAYGTLINYAPPSFTNSGLYGELLELEDMVGVLMDPSVSDSTKQVTIKNVETLCKKLGLEYNGADDLHQELGEMKASIIPKGLHILGEGYGEEDLAKLLFFILSRDNPGAPSLTRSVARECSYPEKLDDARRNDVNDMALGLIRDACIREQDVDASEDVIDALEYGRRLKNNILESDEPGMLLHGLGGGFVRANISGDPIRTPEVFPTGRNSYMFDPRLVPTQAAYERGVQIAENTIMEFLGENGRYPETVGVILWGFETAKTRGETVGQILAYLGLKVIQGKSWYPAIEVVPLEALRRPRIDVNINICGFFRDMFPNLVESLNAGVAKVAALDEDVSVNFVKKHTIRMADSLEAAGYWTDEVSKLSMARMFGPAPGEYGTNLPSIIETSEWESETQLAEQYRQKMGHVYGPGMMGRQNDEVLTIMLNTTDIVSQVRDSHEYELSDLDHYYEFLGGLAKSVEYARGHKPSVLVSDTTYEKIKTMGVSRAITRGIYTRVLNPEWVNGMLKHDFHGAKKVADRVEYLIGFAATVGVKSEIFQNVAEGLMFNEKMLRALKKNNIFATRDISKRLMEAEKRKYWKASPEDLKKLQDIYLSIEKDIENGT